MTLALFLLYMFSGPLIVAALTMVVYLLALLAFTRLQGVPKAEVAGKAALIAGALVSVLIMVLVMGPDWTDLKNVPVSVLVVVAMTALIWIPLGDLIWWGTSRLRGRICPR